MPNSKSKFHFKNIRQKISWVDILMGVAFSFMWGSAFTSARIIVQHAPPLTISALRFLIAGSIAVSIAYLLRQSLAATWAQWRAITIVGICQNALYLGLIFVGMQWIEASLATILASTLPLLVAIFNRIIFNKKLHFLGICGLIGGFVGVALILGDRVSNDVDLKGIVACGIGVLALTLATLSVREASSGGNLVMVIGIQMLIGGSVLGLISIFFEQWYFTWSLELVLAFSYTLIVPGLIATWIWFKLIERVGPTHASSFHFLNPVFGVLTASAILNEVMSPSDFGAVFIIAIGILAVQISRSNK